MFYNEPNEITIPEDLLEFLTATFTKSLYKEVWTQLLDKYPSIIGTENVLVSPTMEIGMKEDIKRKHGYMKSKELFAFDMVWPKNNHHYSQQCGLSWLLRRHLTWVLKGMKMFPGQNRKI